MDKLVYSWPEMTIEFCNECESEVEIPSVVGLYSCPNCKKPLVNCSFCLDSAEGAERDCNTCEWSIKADKLRKAINLK